MKILALEAAAHQVGLAALHLEDDDAQVRALLTLEEPRALSQSVIRALQSTLSHANWTLDDLDGLAVGIGPGSWTGLRIALSTMKTLAQVRELPLAGIPSFNALAQAAWRELHSEETGVGGDEHGMLVVTAPCRPGEVYGKIFEAHPEYLMVAQEEWIASPQLLADALLTQAMAREATAPPIVVGEDEAMLQHLRDAGEKPIVVQYGVEEAVVEIALAAAAIFAEGQADDPLTLQPLYIAASNAERNLGIGL